MLFETFAALEEQNYDRLKERLAKKIERMKSKSEEPDGNYAGAGYDQHSYQVVCEVIPQLKNAEERNRPPSEVIGLVCRLMTNAEFILIRK